MARPDAAAKGRTATLGLAIGGAFLFLFLPSLAREAVGWALAFGIVSSLSRGRRDLPAIAWSALILTMAAGSVAAFRERLLPFLPGAAALAQAESIGAAARRAQPALASPLVRASVGPEGVFGANTAFAARLSALDGYFFPSRRFVELVCALRGQAYQPNQLIVRMPEDHPTSRPMFQLYDVAWRVRASGSAVEVTPLTRPAGPAWFSGGFTRAASFASLGHDLRALGDELGRHAHQSLWLVASDPRVAAARLPASVDPACRGARVLEVRARRGEPGASARVQAPADCPLTFAVSYAETLKARVTAGDGRDREVAVFPAYGALAAVWVPRGATDVRIEAVPPRLPWPGAWILLGLGVLAAVAWITFRPEWVDPPGQRR
jgi:hypothetical protein